MIKFLPTLRWMIDVDSPEISDFELEEIENMVNFDELFSYEYSGNFILTKNLVDREVAVESMCCGIYVRDFKLSNGETVYFAFDYGH